MLCYLCRRIFQGSFPHTTTHHHYHIDDLKLASSENCAICKVLWDAISVNQFQQPKCISEVPRVRSDAGSKPISQYTICRSPDSGIAYLLSFSVDASGIGTDGCIGYSLEFALAKIQPDYSLLGIRDLHSHTGSTSSMAMAKEWLLQCRENHPLCNSVELSIPRRTIPMRLLQIGSPNQDSIRLLPHPLSNKQPKNPYATLSHCWGSASFFTLTSGTVRQLIEGIPISKLSQTFQDAIVTVRSMGVTLIWIDSLCIFQDSKKDWQQQAPLMEDIYRGALFNVAATASADGSGGCFRERNHLLIKACTIQTAWDDKANDLYQLQDTDFWHKAFENQPLTKRAWVVQELLLPQRILHFNEKQIFWQCYQLATCEGYSHGIPPSNRYQGISHDAMREVMIYAGKDLSDRKEPASDALEHTSLELWSKVLQRYTKCGLTYSKDKLIAISGVARLLQRALDDDYCAGLWRKHMATQLLWQSSSDKPRSTPYRAPSWSWASVDTAVSPNSYDLVPQDEVEILVKIVSCQISTATKDLFSEVTYGEIEVSGPLVTMEFRSDSGPGWSIFVNGRWWDHVHMAQITLDYKLPSHRLHCLPILVDIHQFPESWSIACILLAPTENSRGQFRRCGTLFAFRSVFGLDDWGNFLTFENEEWLEYERVVSPGVYTISII